MPLRILNERPDSSEKVKYVLLTVKDVTDLIKAQKEALDGAALLRVAGDKARFRLFLADYNAEIDKAKAAVAKGDHSIYYDGPQGPVIFLPDLRKSDAPKLVVGPVDMWAA